MKLLKFSEENFLQFLDPELYRGVSMKPFNSTQGTEFRIRASAGEIRERDKREFFCFLGWCYRCLKHRPEFSKSFPNPVVENGMMPDGFGLTSIYVKPLQNHLLGCIASRCLT